jgi:hypothetical protein
VPRLNSLSKKPLVVQSHCGELAYLSPLGVMMATQQFMSYQKTTPTTTQQKQKKKQEIQKAPTDALNLKNLGGRVRGVYVRG